MVAFHCGVATVSMPSPPPRNAMSRPMRARLTRCSAAVRIASSRRRRSASAAARSAAAGSSAFGGSGSNRRDFRWRARPPSRDSRRRVRAGPSGLLDEGEILLGERQDGDLGQVDLLAAREFEQEIEGPSNPSTSTRKACRSPLFEGSISKGVPSPYESLSASATKTCAPGM